MDVHGEKRTKSGMHVKTLTLCDVHGDKRTKSGIHLNALNLCDEHVETLTLNKWLSRQ
jgi:hypothetical protein